MNPLKDKKTEGYF